MVHDESDWYLISRVNRQPGDGAAVGESSIVNVEDEFGAPPVAPPADPWAGPLTGKPKRRRWFRRNRKDRT